MKVELIGHRIERFARGAPSRQVGTELAGILIASKRDDHAVYRDALARQTGN